MNNIPRFAIFVLVIFIVFVEDRTSLVEKYFQLRMIEEEIQYQSQAMYQNAIPRLSEPARTKLQNLEKMMSDFKEFKELASATRIPNHIIESMKSSIAYLSSSNGEAIRKSFRNYYENSENLLKKKKVSDFTQSRIGFFNNYFFQKNSARQLKQYDAEINSKFIPIYWRLTHPNKPDDQIAIKKKIDNAAKESSDFVDEFMKAKKMPDPLLLVNLLCTMLLSDAEFEAYRTFAMSKASIELDVFTSDLLH